MNYQKQTIQQVWEKGIILPGNDPEVWRADSVGNWIRRPDFQKRDSEYGWEIVRINPRGGFEIDNLKPLHWENALEG